MHVAYLTSDGPENSVSVANVVRGLNERGYVEGRNMRLDKYWGHGSIDRAAAQIPAIVASRPDVVLAMGGQIVRPLKEAGVVLPVVFSYSGDPVVAGIVKSYARPGGNFTGISFFLAEIVAKRVEILREIMPGVKRMAFVGWSRHAGEPLEVQASLAAARSAGIEASYFPTTALADIVAAYEKASSQGVQAISAFADGVTLANATAMADLSRRLRMPLISGWAEYTYKGALFSWGPNREASYVHMGSFVDRIVRGTKPADIPVERPAVLEFVLNTRAARDLGIAIPPSVLARASQSFD